jgi:hypothetical protein
MSYRRAVQIFFILMLLGLAAAALAGIPLTWDGAYYFFNTLDTRFPFIPHGRTIDVALEFPLLAASHFTDDLAPLRIIFSLCYVVVPALGLATSWLICRDRRPSLFVWPALSCCIAMLPGQAAFSSEAIMTPWLMWPVLLAALIGARRSYLPILAILIMAAFLAHPIAGAFLAFSALAAAIAGLRSIEARRERLLSAIVLALLALARVLMPLSEYESERLSTSLLMSAFQTAVMGLPLIVLILSVLVAIFLLISASTLPASRVHSISSYIALALTATAGACLIIWAIPTSRWAWALAFRFWAAPITLTFMAAASIEALFLAPPAAEDETTLQRGRMLIIPIIGGVFLAVLTIQSLSWNGLTRRLQQTLNQAPSGCIPRYVLFWARRTPLDHWGAAPYAIDVQTRKPRTMVMDANSCREFAATGEVRLSKLSARAQGGWFELDGIPRTIIHLHQMEPPPD